MNTSSTLKTWKLPKLMSYIFCGKCKIKVDSSKSECVICGTELRPYSIEHFEREAKKENLVTEGKSTAALAYSDLVEELDSSEEEE